MAGTWIHPAEGGKTKVNALAHHIVTIARENCKIQTKIMTKTTAFENVTYKALGEMEAKYLEDAPGKKKVNE